jgi:hypothetical protein
MIEATKVRLENWTLEVSGPQLLHGPCAQEHLSHINEFTRLTDAQYS